MTYKKMAVIFKKPTSFISIFFSWEKGNVSKDSRICLITFSILYFLEKLIYLFNFFKAYV